MSYSTSNPPVLKSVSPLTGAGQTWVYRSTDPATDVDAVAYFTNGDKLGMRVGDIVEVTDTDTSTTMTFHRVITVTAGTGATVSTTGLTIT
jgi:hypothetical protein